MINDNINKLLKYLFIVVIVFSCGNLSAQNLSGPTSVEENSIHTYTFNDGTTYLYDGWDVSGGTLISNSESGSTYTAVVQWGVVGSGSISFKRKTIIVETLNVTINQPVTVVTELNYIHNITPRTATTDITTLTDNNKIESITYFDGLGRARQSIGIRAGGNSEDIITHIEYDQYGRVEKEYLPYSSSTDIGAYRPDGLDATLNYYNASSYEDDFPAMGLTDINPYSEKELESSPISRVFKQAAPGKDWKMGNGHEIEMEYLTNTSATEVRHYKVSLVKSEVLNTVTYVPTLLENGYYAVNELYKTVTKDENHSGTDKDHTTEEFKNKQGQVVLKRTYESEIAHDTYYVYDDFGNLSYVLPPKSEAHTAKPDATELSELCYQYKYDHRSRLVEKKIPGKGWESIIYNRLDQPVMTQDKELKNANKWLVTKYDIFGRVVYTGIKNTNGSRTDFQNIFNNNGGAIWENKNSIGTGYMNTYYTSNVFPSTLDEIHTINYYDNYYFDLNGGLSETAYGVTPITNVKGLATGSKVRVLGTNDWITTVTYYDEKSRPIYVYSKNDYLGSTDKIKNELNFDGTVTGSTSSHNKNFPIINVTDKYTYDHMNRLTLHTQLLNNAALPEVISENEYDDLGQLVKKGVGNKENLTQRLQDVDYEYNIRGWLKRINKVNELEGDLFSFEIEYNTPSQSGADGLFNGNISQINWQTENDEVLYSYVYGYDALNRIKGAGFYGQNSNDRYNLSNITYDKNGNILSLTRNGHVVASPDRNIGSHFGVMDQLTYTYENSSNRLKKVDDSANSDYGFKDGSNTATEYTYDNNGNMLTDANKGISSISYNHLNLPTSVSLPGGNITYIYDATGVKQKKIVSSGATTEYAGNYIYENGTLKMFSHAEGYVEPVTLGRVSEFNYVYQYKDHLGNIRLTYMDKNQNNKAMTVLEIIEENNYYPFGLKHKGYNNMVSANVNSVASKFKFGGKELNDELGLDWYDFGARNYDASLGRWFTIDPKADDVMQIDLTPYNYSWNNPINVSDPDGECPMCWGFVIGALVDYSVQVAGNLAAGKDLGDALTQVDTGSILISGTAGALTGGLSAINNTGVKVGVGLAIDIAEEGAQQLNTNKTLDISTIDTEKLATDVIQGKFIDKTLGDVIKPIKKVSADKVKTAERKLDRAERVAGDNPRPSRQQAVADAKKDVSDLSKKNTAADVGNQTADKAAKKVTGAAVTEMRTGSRGGNNRFRVRDERSQNVRVQDNTSVRTTRYRF